MPSQQATPAVINRGGNAAVTAKARARIARTLQVEADLPPTARERGDISLDRHLRTRYIPNQVPFTTLRCAEYVYAEDVEWLVQVFERFSVLSTDEEENLSNVNELYVKMKSALEEGAEMLTNVASAPPRKSMVSSTCSTRDTRSVRSASVVENVRDNLLQPLGPSKKSDLVAKLLKSSPSFIQRRKSFSNKNVSFETEKETDARALSTEWFVELLLNRIALRLPEVVPVQGSNGGATTASHKNSTGGEKNGDEESTTKDEDDNNTSGAYGEDCPGPLNISLKRALSNVSSSSGHSEASVSRRLQGRRAKEERLAIFREELLQWMKPIQQMCNQHKHPMIWERCEIQASLLEEFHQWVLKEDPPPVEPTGPSSSSKSRETTVVPAVTGGISTSGSSHHIKGNSAEGSTTEGSHFRRSASPPSRTGRIKMLGEDATPLSEPSPTILDLPDVPRTTSMYSMASLDSEGITVPTCYLSYYGFRTDGSSSISLMEAVADPVGFASQVLERSSTTSYDRFHPSSGSGNSASPTDTAGKKSYAAALAMKRSKKRKRRPPNDHSYIRWSDFTNNLIMDDAVAETKTYEDTTYVRVHTVTLEEGAAEVVDGVGEDVNHSDSDDGNEDNFQLASLSFGGQRSRAKENKNKVKAGMSNQQADLEAFSKELNQLHVMSADHVVVSPNGQRIYTSSKDFVVKAWDARRGQFIANVLNVGNSWVIQMFLLHDGQFLLVATTNAEITIVDVTSYTIVKKMRGCPALETALTKVVQHSTEHIQRFGMRPGETGAHRPTYKEGMSFEAFMTARKDAQRTTSSTTTDFPVQSIEGFVYPTAFYFDHDSSLCFFGTAEGILGVFDLSEEVQRTALNAGAATGATHHPLRLLACVQGHHSSVTGVAYIPLSHCLMSVAEDGTVSRLTVSQETYGEREFTFGDSTLSIPYTPRHPIRFMEYCASYRYMATSHSDRRVLLWSIGRSFTELLHVYPQEMQDIISVAFLPQQQQVALLLADHTIRIYDFRGHKPATVISPPVNVENHAMDIASYTLLASADDSSDGCLSYIPQMERVVLALRGPVLYQSLGKAKAIQKEGAAAVDSPDVDPPLAHHTDSPAFRRRSSESYVASVNQLLEEDSEASAGELEKRYELKKHNFVSRVEQRNDDNRRRIEERMEQRRLEPHGTHSRPVLDVVIHPKKAELHTLSVDRWKVWDLHTGTLKEGVDLPAEVRQVFPMYPRTTMLCCGWTSENRTRLMVGARNGLAFTLDGETMSVAEGEKVLQTVKQEVDRSETDDVSVIHHQGQRLLLCCGRVCIVKKFKVGSILPSGAEECSTMSVKIPVQHSTITACCIVRDTHFCLGTSDNRLYLYRMVDRGAPYMDEVLCNFEKDNTPDVGAVIGLTYVNDSNQNLIISVLDTGVVHFYSYIRNQFLGRLRLFKEHSTLLKKVIFVSSENYMICGDTIGVVRVYDLQRYINSQVVGQDKRTSLALDVSAASMSSSTAASDFMTRFSKKESIPLLFAYQGASDEINALAYYQCSSRAVGGVIFDIGHLVGPVSKPSAAPVGILSSKTTTTPTPAPSALVTSSLQTKNTTGTAVDNSSSKVGLLSPMHGSPSPLGAASDPPGRERFVICGSADGNVRMHRLCLPRENKGRKTSASTNANTNTNTTGGGENAVDKKDLGQAKTLGLFGVDTWDIADRETYALTVVPSEEGARLAAQRQNELLSTLLQQARRLSQSSAKDPSDGTPPGLAATTQGAEKAMDGHTIRKAAVPSSKEEPESAAQDDVQAQPFTAPHTLQSLLPATHDKTLPAVRAPPGGSTVVKAKPIDQHKYTRNPLVKSYPMRWLRKIGVAQAVRAGQDDDGDVLIPSDVAFSPETFEQLNPVLRDGPEALLPEDSSSLLESKPQRRETRRPRDSTTTFLTAVQDMEEAPHSAVHRRSTLHRQSATDTLMDSTTSVGSTQRRSLTDSRHSSITNVVDRRPTAQAPLATVSEEEDPRRKAPASAPLPPPSHTLPERVMEERRDQLMLSHLARQLDRSRPKENYDAQLQRRWQERAGEREVAEAIQEAIQHGDRRRRKQTGSPFSPTSTLNARPEAKKTGLGLELDLLDKPIEMGSADIMNKDFNSLSARERIERTLAEYKRRENTTRQERREKAAVSEGERSAFSATYSSAEPFEGRAPLPHVTARQQLHPFSITLPSTMAHDESSKWRLKQLETIVPRHNGPLPEAKGSS